MFVPIVNVSGFAGGDRYMPDRRDLNRSFPGSTTGSLAGRIADVFMTRDRARCDVGIDLHTGSDHRRNLPQIRGDLDDAAPATSPRSSERRRMLHAGLRDGSLRAAATDAGATVLLFEGGEAWRFDADAIRVRHRGRLEGARLPGAWSRRTRPLRHANRSRPRSSLVPCSPAAGWPVSRRARRGGVERAARRRRPMPWANRSAERERQSTE